MRILTWNINSLRTLAQYHPWNTLKTQELILNHLESDIICFQEVKSTRAALAKHAAVPDCYDSFFSFPVQKGGYSGVAVYTKSATVVPLKAEEGLTGILQPKPPLSDKERISPLSHYPPYDYEEDDIDYHGLDAEGRSLVLDFGLFVLINVYCPNDATGTDSRIKYKNDFHNMLKRRVKSLVEDEKREVIVLGDLNACAGVEDHCEGEILVKRGREEGLEGDEGFFGTYEPREWLRSWLHSEANPSGLVDITRRFWPDRKGMYTCWNTRISARDSNYGTRIDYILITPGLLPWVKGSDIQPHIKGSDHCPVFIDFYEEITDANGMVLKLKDVFQCSQDPPRLAARFWDEYSGKQKVLDTFFSRKKPVQETRQSAASTLTSSSEPEPSPKRKAPSNSSHNATKRLKSEPSSAASLTAKKSGQKQSTLGSFFAGTSSLKEKHKAPVATDDPDLEADYLYALSLSQEAESMPLSPSSQSSSMSASQSWSSILAPLKPPLCTIHGEPAKELKVTKKGVNKGKGFWICSRPLGPGYDKGRSERPRNEVDPRWRCNFFKWSSDVRKDMLKANSSTIS